MRSVQSDKKLAAEARLAGLMEHAGGLMLKGNYDGVRDQNPREHERCLSTRSSIVPFVWLPARERVESLNLSSRPVVRCPPADSFLRNLHRR